jgi:DNA-directed RNA polymerase subunit RPC12/RpoP
MSYEKLLVDNTACSRRFHLTFDNEAPLAAKVEVKCPHCQHMVFEAENHPPVKLARDENLVRTTSLSRNLVKECDFKDPFPAKK